MNSKSPSPPPPRSLSLSLFCFTTAYDHHLLSDENGICHTLYIHVVYLHHSNPFIIITVYIHNPSSLTSHHPFIDSVNLSFPCIHFWISNSIICWFFTLSEFPHLSSAHQILSLCSADLWSFQIDRFLTMATVVVDLISAIQHCVKPRHDDGVVDRLHYVLAPMVLMFMACFHGLKQYFGQPILVRIICV